MIRQHNFFMMLAFFAYILPSANVSAQFLEAGFVLEASNYKGDIASRIENSEFQPAYGMTLRYNISRYFSVRGNLLTAYVSGTDQNVRNAAIRERNLSFRSEITELSVQGEYSPLGFDMLDGKVSSPYLFAGVGGFYFNPQAELSGTWYDLQPLGTEGQGTANGGKKYSRFSVVVPMGLGFRFALSKRVNLGFEFGAHATLTDYLDDVSKDYPTDVMHLYEANPVAARLSYRKPEMTGEPFTNPAALQRGNPNTKDMYFFGGVSVSFNLTDKYGLEWDKKYRIHE